MTMAYMNRQNSESKDELAQSLLSREGGRTKFNRFTQSDEHRRDELIRIIEHSVEKLTLQELEALYYDMSTKNYIND